jgi:hypothetical protein
VKKTAIAVTVFVLAVIGLLVYSSLGLRKHRVEVCVSFQGRTNCRVASGSTREQAVRAATDNACALLASGMTDSMACTSAPPISVKSLE